MNKYQVAYDKNFQALMREAQKCSCWNQRGAGKRKCSNEKHHLAVIEERRLNSLCMKHQNEK